MHHSSAKQPATEISALYKYYYYEIGVYAMAIYTLWFNFILGLNFITNKLFISRTLLL